MNVEEVGIRMQWPDLILPVKSRKLLSLLLGGATYFTNLFNADLGLTDVFRTTQCSRIPKSRKLVQAF